MTDPDRILTPAEYTLIENAKRWQPDATLEPIADAMDRGDTAAWAGLHPILQDRAGIYRDLRASMDEAINRGLIRRNTTN